MKRMCEIRSAALQRVLNQYEHWQQGEVGQGTVGYEFLAVLSIAWVYAAVEQRVDGLPVGADKEVASIQQDVERIMAAIRGHHLDVEQEVFVRDLLQELCELRALGWR